MKSLYALPVLALLALAPAPASALNLTTDVLGRTVCADGGALTKWDGSGNVVACVIRTSIAVSNGNDRPETCDRPGHRRDPGCSSCDK